jgi:hypothetical protein
MRMAKEHIVQTPAKKPKVQPKPTRVGVTDVRIYLLNGDSRKNGQNKLDRELKKMSAAAALKAIAVAP